MLLRLLGMLILNLLLLLLELLLLVVLEVVMLLGPIHLHLHLRRLVVRIHLLLLVGGIIAPSSSAVGLAVPALGLVVAHTSTLVVVVLLLVALRVVHAGRALRGLPLAHVGGGVVGAAPAVLLPLLLLMLLLMLLLQGVAVLV